jgi:hypothetical protein
MPQYFTIVGHPELALKYQSRENTRVWLMLGGGAIVLGSLIASAAIASAAPDPASCANSSDYYCPSNVAAADTRHQNIAWGVGAGGTLVGVVMACWGMFMSPMPVSPGEAAALGDQYDRQLWHRLGLGLLDGSEASGHVPLALSLTPVVGAGAEGLSMKLSF